MTDDGIRCTPIDVYRRLRSQEAVRRPEFHLEPHHPATLEIRSRAEIHLEWLRARISARIEREEQHLAQVNGVIEWRHLTWGEYRNEVQINPHVAWETASAALADARRRRRARQDRAMTPGERQRRSQRALAALQRWSEDGERQLAREASEQGWDVENWRFFMNTSEEDLWRIWRGFYEPRSRVAPDLWGSDDRYPFFLAEADLEQAVEQWRLARLRRGDRRVARRRRECP